MKYCIVGWFLVLLSISLYAETYYTDPRVADFLKEISKKHNLDYQENLNLFKKIKIRKSEKKQVINHTLNPAEKRLSWERYYLSFVNPARIEAGMDFWRENEPILKKAEKEFGVPVSIVVATIGLETFYGRNLGKFYVFPTLVWLAFDGSVRKKFYRKQLEYLLIIRNENPWFKNEFFKIKSSYSGAMGWGQFIPQSYKSFAVDFNFDGDKNLINDLHDAIGSVAYYYKRAGWNNEKKVAEKLKRKPKSKKNILFLEYKKEKQYWKTYHNFKVIKRYNNNNFYALTLYLLSVELANEQSKVN